MPKFFTQFDRNISPSVRFSKPSMTEQAHKDEFDINRLIKRATRSGVLATVDQIRSVYYGDFSEVGQSFENHLKIKEAEERFLALPSDVRDYFHNDPKRLLDALGDDKQLGKLIDLGLVRKPDPVVGTPENPIPVAPAVPSSPAAENTPTA